ncbi:MAG: dihydrofolate reductase, partial [Pseudolabrys sp.]
MQIVLVAAIGENGVIGQAGQLPWRLKSDMQHFRALTIGKPVIMGRKTYESIGKPLKDRSNIVLTRDLSLVAPGTVLATSMGAAFGYAHQEAAKRGVDEIMVIGGGGVFADSMSRANRLEITHVHASPDGDSFFPPIDPG